ARMMDCCCTVVLSSCALNVSALVLVTSCGPLLTNIVTGICSGLFGAAVLFVELVALMINEPSHRVPAAMPVGTTATLKVPSVELLVPPETCSQLPPHDEALVLTL